MSSSPAPPREPITDSPWFWIYLFATTALVLLILFRGKMDIRQAEIEREHQARQIAAENRVMTDESLPSEEVDAEGLSFEVSSPGNTRISLNYIYAVLGLLIAVGWARLWYVRFRTVGLASSNEPT
ncbi:hypothetical protein [Blastopirellula marina]|uniref:Uncharacterized protein n=1 Tax=Blastopirellula marina TaxID=124 RepID=A0A2S8GVQ6_9BACT|nr:hypothetical protein [Blastopirellula marina]PQO48124.1 hypothetical protein C5Y93_00135 [Blastopirellula marina]